jgi:hypothetical protein
VVGGASPTAAAEAGRAAAASVANDIDAVSASEGISVGATTSPVSAPNITTTNFGPEVDTSLESQGAYSGNTGGGGGSPASQGETSSQSGEGNPGESNSTSSSTGEGNPGESYAKGGFITKKNKPAVKAKRGLASRK